jgi:hypothetical protein
MRKELMITNYTMKKGIGYTPDAREKAEGVYDSLRILLIGAVGLYIAMKITKKKTPKVDNSTASSGSGGATPVEGGNNFYL